LKLGGGAGLEPNAGILGVDSFVPLGLEAPNWKAVGVGVLVKLKLGTVAAPNPNVGALGAVSFVPLLLALEAPNWKVGGAGLLLKPKVDGTEDELAASPKLGREVLFSATPLIFDAPTAEVVMGLVEPNNEPPLADVVCTVPLVLPAPNLKVGAVVLEKLKLPVVVVALAAVVAVEELAGNPNAGRVGLFSDNPLVLGVEVGAGSVEVEPNIGILGVVSFVPLVFEIPNLNVTGAGVLFLSELVELVIELETEGVTVETLDVNPNLNFESGGGNVDGFSVGASLELAVVPSLLVIQQGHEFLSAST